MQNVNIPKTNGLLNQDQFDIIKNQVKKNSEKIEQLIRKVDLLVNREKHLPDSSVVARMKEELRVLMSENDTFRRVYWKHLQLSDEWREFQSAIPDPITYLVDKIRARQKASAF